jgi:tight adherence protein B
MMDSVRALAGNYVLVILTLVFVAILLFLEGLYLLWKSYRGTEAKKLRERLRALSASAGREERAKLLRQQGLSEVPLLERLLLAFPRAHRLQTAIRQADLDWTVSRLLLSCAAAGGFGCLAVTSLARQSLATGVAAGLLLAALPLLYVLHKRSRRLVRIEQQLPDAIDLMIRALRAGHAFSASLQMVGNEMPDPIAGECRLVHDEVNFGVSLQQALLHLGERVPVTDLRYFIVAVLIQRESGGNLTEILGNLSRLIRERLKLMAKVRVLSAEGRLSAWILVLMPFGLGAAMNMANPEFMSPLWTDPLGIAITKYTLALMAIGVLVLRKIVRIRV